MFDNFSWLSVVSIIVRIVIFGGILQGFFLALVLTAKKNRKKKSNRILAILLVVLSLSIMHSVFVAGYFTGPYRIKEPLVLAIGPLLLFYVGEFTALRRFSLKDVVHFIPLPLFAVMVISGQAESANSSYGGFLSRNSVPLSIIVWSLIVAQYGFYWWKSVRIIRKNKAAVESEFSSIEGKPFRG